MKNFSIKAALPYLAALVLFLILSLVYFYPLLEGKQIFQSDIANYKGMSKEIVDFRNQTGTEPLWTNSMFGGMPAYQISVVYKSNLAISSLIFLFHIRIRHIPGTEVILVLSNS